MLNGVAVSLGQMAFLGARARRPSLALRAFRGTFVDTKSTWLDVNDAFSSKAVVKMLPTRHFVYRCFECLVCQKGELPISLFEHPPGVVAMRVLQAVVEHPGYRPLEHM